eukprot:GHVQ01000439.1.p1 GENE.GHVQ01000439.1~~GHVQ01000439.1.p1  ORF type:complete len:203 (+),score=26.14 GHVQ01000439.1:450-1058(+)
MDIVYTDSSLYRKLQALGGCPFITSADLIDAVSVEDTTRGYIRIKPQTFPHIVIWLEEQKIRFYTPKERINLRSLDEPSLWWTALYKYCYELGIVFQLNPVPGNVSRCRSILERLTHTALQDVYIERTTQDPPLTLTPVPTNSVAAGSQDGSNDMKESESLVDSVNTMLCSLNLPPLCHNSHDTDDALLSAALKVSSLCDYF